MSLGWNVYRQDCEPLRDLAWFVQHGSQDALTRQMAAAALVLTLAQAAGPAAMAKPPGLLLVNAGPLPVDPVDAVAKHLFGPDGVGPKASDKDAFQRARRYSRTLYTLSRDAIIKGNRIGAGAVLSDIPQARREAFGKARAGCYSARHDAELGWVTDPTNHVTLRLQSEGDREAFFKDVRDGAKALKPACGMCPISGPVPKLLSLSGAIPSNQWDADLVSGVVEFALPILPLPHMATAPLIGADCATLTMMASGLEEDAGKRSGQTVEAVETMGFSPWVGNSFARLRQRLKWFPDDYAWFVENVARQMPAWCNQISKMAVTKATSEDDCCNFWLDLLAQVIGGLRIGIESLGWHGYGFDAGCSRQELRRLLAVVREAGTISKRDLQRRCQWLGGAESRDEVLDALKSEGLVALGDREVTAVSFADYLRDLPGKGGLGDPPVLWKVNGADQPSGFSGVGALLRSSHSNEDTKQAIRREMAGALG